MEKKKQLNAQIWLDKARETLIKEGIKEVKIKKLAEQLKTTRSSFYWHFKDHQHLLQELLRVWREQNTIALTEMVRNGGSTLEDKLLALFGAWMETDKFDVSLDTAVREWARVSDIANEAVRQADRVRLACLTEVFKEAGFSEVDAMTRARVIYYTQVGYYALGFVGEAQDRVKFTGDYYRVYTGQEISEEGLRKFQARYQPTDQAE
jgi:AcrR family transcriptional regulator